MDTIAYYKQQFDQLQSAYNGKGVSELRKNAFSDFARLGIPTVRNEEWKYTRIAGLFNKDFKVAVHPAKEIPLSSDELAAIRLPHTGEANELVFVNGVYAASLSTVISSDLIVLPLDEAARNSEYKDIVAKNMGHSQQYLKDGINALNTALAVGGTFIYIPSGKSAEHPVYVYHITDARQYPILAQPRSLVYVAKAAELKLVDNYATLGSGDSLTNQVLEIVVEQDARFEYYKIQNDKPNANQVSTVHIRQTGKSYVHTVVISLAGNIIRNNLNIVMESPFCEAHLYGLYFTGAQTHVDNHTIVDNASPNCFSNELYKGVLDDNSTGVFNGKIFVKPDAQKINAYQSNKNILLSENATVNTKPQLEIFADDVKCSHGCTVGQLDEEGLFYLRSRGISEGKAKALLLHAFVMDILEQIKLEPVRSFVDELINSRLEY